MWGHGVLPAALPAPFSATLSLALLVYLCANVGLQGLLVVRLPAPVCPTLRQSRSHHGNWSPFRPGCPSPPLLLVWMNVYFLFTWCRTSLPFDFPSVLVVRGGAVCLPMPPSWFSHSCAFEFHLRTSNFPDVFFSRDLSSVCRPVLCVYTACLQLGCKANRPKIEFFIALSNLQIVFSLFSSYQ